MKGEIGVFVVVCRCTGYGIPVGHPAAAAAAMTARPSQPAQSAGSRAAAVAGTPGRTYVGFTSPGTLPLRLLIRTVDYNPHVVSRTPTNIGVRAFSAARPRVWNYLQTARLVIQQLQAVAGGIFIWSAGPKRSVNPPLNCTLEILLLTYFQNAGRPFSFPSPVPSLPLNGLGERIPAPKCNI